MIAAAEPHGIIKTEFLADLLCELVGDALDAREVEHAVIPRAHWDAQQSTRVLLLVTSHLSTQHLSFMRTCWPPAMQRSTVLRSANVLLFVGWLELESQS